MKRPAEAAERMYRSMLQKAVRRGADNLVFTGCALLESRGPREKNWVRKRCVNIAFEECWPLGTELLFTRGFHSRVAALVKTARAVKDRAAAGLGALAHALSAGDRSVMSGTDEDRHIRVVARAIQRPDDFWKWASRKEGDAATRLLIENAMRFRNMGQPVEKACTTAAAFLAVEEGCPEPPPDGPRQRDFPYWIVFDRHTREGERAIRDVARDLHLPAALLEWIFFYFEGAVAGGEKVSKWWRRMCRWKFQQAGIPEKEAFLVWEPAKTQLMDALAEDAHRLHGKVYRWKMANLERVREIKTRVERYITDFGGIHGGQRPLF